MTHMKSVGAITLFVEDLERSKRFYQDVFRAPLIFEDQNSAVFRFENTIINLLVISEARELIEPGVVAGREAGSRFQLTVWVDDADAVCEQLASRGVTLLNGPMDRVWGKRTACFTDPDGACWEIAQDLHSPKPQLTSSPRPLSLTPLGPGRPTLPQAAKSG
jgi:catechol 2,3-dioxygenase-like lactoylglutathione lyase family enzyme